MPAGCMAVQGPLPCVAMVNNNRQGRDDGELCGDKHPVGLCAIYLLIACLSVATVM